MCWLLPGGASHPVLAARPVRTHTKTLERALLCPSSSQPHESHTKRRLLPSLVSSSLDWGVAQATSLTSRWRRGGGTPRYRPHHGCTRGWEDEGERKARARASWCMVCARTQTDTKASGFMHLRNIVEKSPILRKPKAARRRYTTITGVILTPVILGGCC